MLFFKPGGLNQNFQGTYSKELKVDLVMICNNIGILCMNEHWLQILQNVQILNLLEECSFSTTTTPTLIIMLTMLQPCESLSSAYQNYFYHSYLYKKHLYNTYTY